MFERLNQEIQQIKTRRFHVLERLPSAELSALGDLPASYVEFLAVFGRAKLYRELDYYVVGVYPVSTHYITSDLLSFGHYDAESVFFSSRFGKTSPVFTLQNSKATRVASTFEDWLEASCESARKRYTK